MAKAKKSGNTTNPETAPEAKAKAEAGPAPKPAKATAKKKAETKAAAPASAGVPLIDTSLAAANAARMVGAKATSVTSTEGKKETSAFKQLKENLSKPPATGMNNFLNSTTSPGAQKSGLPFGSGGAKQPGRNQTFGADVNRFNVPRRTGG